LSIWDKKCDDKWSCDDVEKIAKEAMAENDENKDGVISEEDDEDKKKALLMKCDANKDAKVDMCEMYDCIRDSENQWRKEFCEGEDLLDCKCPK